MNSSVYEYSHPLVMISIGVSIAAAYSAFALAERMGSADSERVRNFWLFFGSGTMGLGIWSMHFLGMLAVKMPMEMHYYVPTVVLSLLLAVGASSVTLRVVSADEIGPQQLMSGALLMGAGIGSMHYIGMAAMSGSMQIETSSDSIWLAIVTAVVFSYMALLIGFSLRSAKYGEWMRVAGGCVMGLGIAAMHYVAMTGVTYHMRQTAYSTAWTVRTTHLGASAVIGVTVIVLAGALGTAILDKRQFNQLQLENTDLEEAQHGLRSVQEKLQKANQVLTELSIRDGLTGLHNRRRFDEVLDMEYRRASRTMLPLALLMIDVDCFKALNDTYGHPYGDDCLRAIAHTLRTHRNYRGYDLLARYGGEEFVLLLPGAETAIALEIADSIRTAIMQLQLEHKASKASRYVTVSVGVCSEVPLAGGSSASLVAQADAALYQAKKLGKNRVIGPHQVFPSDTSRAFGEVALAGA